MKIGIDISQVIYGTGVSVYTKNLVENLLKIDDKNSYLLFGGSLRRKDDLKKFTNGLKGNYKEKISFLSPKLADFLWNRLHIIKIESFIGKVDVFHSSNWTQPPSNAFKVTTVHDLAPIRYPQLMDESLISNTKIGMKWIKKEVDKIIVPSNATRKDLELLGIPARKVVVIPEAADPFYKAVSKFEVDKIKNKYNLSNYILGVGVGERKNSNRLIEAYKLVKDKLNVQLVFVGQAPSNFTKEKDVIFLGHVSNFDLRNLYGGAYCLAYPSLYEGFGLPILQAFACSSPVLTSNISSMPEVAGDAAVLVDPFNVESISEGLLKVGKMSEALVKKGLQQVKKYSWETTAKMTLDVYREAKINNG